MMKCTYCQVSLIGKKKVPLDREENYPEQFCSKECRKQRIYDMIERAQTYDILAQGFDGEEYRSDFRKDAFELRKRARKLLDE